MNADTNVKRSCRNRRSREHGCRRLQIEFFRGGERSGNYCDRRSGKRRLRAGKGKMEKPVSAGMNGFPLRVTISGSEANRDRLISFFVGGIMQESIPVNELKVGMHVTIPGSWFRHPFIRSQFVLNSQRDIERMMNWGLDQGERRESGKRHSPRSQRSIPSRRLPGSPRRQRPCPRT